MEFSRQGYWNGFPFPSSGDIPNSGIKLGSPALQEDSLPSEPPVKPKLIKFNKNYSENICHQTLRNPTVGYKRRQKVSGLFIQNNPCWNRMVINKTRSFLFCLFSYCIHGFSVMFSQLIHLFEFLTLWPLLSTQDPVKFCITIPPYSAWQTSLNYIGIFSDWAWMCL